jgi:hypothetical protein
MLQADQFQVNKLFLMILTGYLFSSFGRRGELKPVGKNSVSYFSERSALWTLHQHSLRISLLE